MNIEEIRKIIDDCGDWWEPGNELIQDVHETIVKMGTFESPLEDELAGLTHQQWQFIQAKRVALTVLDYVLSRRRT